jgi:hypothetical protein
MPRDYRAVTRHQQDDTPAPNPDAAPCPGACNSAWRAAEDRKERRGATHTLTARAGQPVWCPPCVTAIRGALQDLPKLAVLLHMQILRATAAGSEFVSGSRERPLYENEAYALAVEELATFLGDWEDTVREQRGLEALRHYTGNQFVTIDNACRFLPGHLTWLLARHPDREMSEGFGLDLTALYRRAQGMTKSGDVRPEHCDGVLCPNCDLRALEWEVDVNGMATGNVRCRVCRPKFVMTRGEYEQWTKMLAHEARDRGLATTDVLASAGLPR